MKFKFLTLIIGCICMCCLPFIQRPVCAENSVNSVVNDTTVKSGSEKQSKGQDKKDEKKQEEKGKVTPKKTFKQKAKDYIHRIKVELILGTATAIAYPVLFKLGAGLAIGAGDCALPPIMGNVGWALGILGTMSLFTAVGCLASAGVKLLM